VDEDGDKIYWEEIDLLDAETIILYYENGKPTAKILTADEDDSAAEADDEEESDEE
jgi:hypothetical protein